MADIGFNTTIVLVGAAIASVSIVKHVAEATVQILAPKADSAALQLLAALKGVGAVRPLNWDDEEDPDQVAAWKAADAAIALAEGRE